MSGLRRLAYNPRWTWEHNPIELFPRLHSDLWESTGHNPVRMLGSMDQGQLEAAAQDETILTRLLTLGSVPRAAGVNIQTIRFYEREKLLSAPPHSLGIPRLQPA